jgi:oxygen-independent coproporphyrinogen-3 oxidase
LGIQSFSDEELKWMNRIHSSDQSILSINKILDAGIANFSVDLIFGSQLQSDNDLIRNIEIITEKKIPHISCYALTAEPKTLLYDLIKKKKAAEIHSEKQAAQFILTMDLLNQ